jgi:hypothetical protein
VISGRYLVVMRRYGFVESIKVYPDRGIKGQIEGATLFRGCGLDQ